MKFDVFRIGDELYMSSYIRIPRILFTVPELRALSAEARLLYALMLDRLSLSNINGWFDMDGRVYIFYTLAEVQWALACGKDKAGRIMAELDTEKGIGLVQRKRQGLGKPDKLYVRTIPEYIRWEGPEERMQQHENLVAQAMEREKRKRGKYGGRCVDTP